MKKIIMALAIVATIGFASTSALAWGMHGWNGNGNGCGYGAGYSSQVDDKTYQEFLDSTAELRSAIRADRAELAAVMAGQNPDPKRVRALTENIDKNAAAIGEKAEALGLNERGFAGRGAGRGMGRGMGPGMMRGGMMGYGYGSGNGYDCPRW